MYLGGFRSPKKEHARHSESGYDAKNINAPFDWVRIVIICTTCFFPWCWGPPDSGSYMISAIESSRLHNDDQRMTARRRLRRFQVLVLLFSNTEDSVPMSLYGWSDVERMWSDAGED
jgi:hypothetical protein